jgi:acyl-CoA dehydrogenase
MSKQLFRSSVRKWVDKEVIPNIEKWESDGLIPRSIYRQAASLGIFSPGYPEVYGGLGNSKRDLSYSLIINEELCRARSGGFLASLLTLHISLPPIVDLGKPDVIHKVVPAVLAGEAVCSLCITEPSGGSDVANMRTTAVQQGDQFILNGEKTLITSGMQADFYTVAARTGGVGPSGISLFLVERNTPGFSRTKLDKMGWLCSDTASLHFDNCLIPSAHLLGELNKGFIGIMKNFNSERLGLSMQSIFFSKELIGLATDWARERQTFGKRLVDHQAIRHLLVDMHTKTACAEGLMKDIIRRYEAGEDCVPEICMLKNAATDCFHYCADSAVQIMGGAGFIRGHAVERLYRETKVMQIGGGSTEIMKELAAKQLGLLS